MADEISVYVVQRKDRTNLVLRYFDPVTRKPIDRSAGTSRRQEAERKAGKWQAELNEGRYLRDSRLEWATFVDKWFETVAPTLALSTVANYGTMIKAFERHTRPQRVSDITTQRVAAYASGLRADGLSEASVKRHLSTLRALAKWAQRCELLPKVPNFDMPKRGTVGKMKGRPVTGEEFDRMLAATEGVVGATAAESWQTLLRGLWWSGLRLGEAMALRWDQQPGGVWVCLEGRESVIAFDSGSQKSGRSELVPLAPEATEMLEAMQQASGYVFEPLRLRGGQPMQRTPHKISQIVSKIGKAAGVVVDPETGKCASAHDLRRAFGFRWSRRIMPAELMDLMRHKEISTTMQFYVGRNAKATAESLWSSVCGTSCDTSGNGQLASVEATQKTLEKKA